MTDASDFPSDRSELRDFDHSLRCSICKELFDAPVSLKCGHCFCSECIRSYVLYTTTHHSESRCPECRQKCTTSDIRPLSQFLECTQLYKSCIRPLLLKCPNRSIESGYPSGEDKRSRLVRAGSYDVKAPPALHMASLTAAQLRKKLIALNLNSAGNKQILAERYKQFRCFVQVEIDKGGRRSLSELATAFEKRFEETKAASQGSNILDCFHDIKTENPKRQINLRKTKKI